MTFQPPATEAEIVNMIDDYEMSLEVRRKENPIMPAARRGLEQQIAAYESRLTILRARLAEVRNG